MFVVCGLMKVKLIHTADELDQLMNEVIADAGFRLDRVSLSESQDWVFRAGAFSHRTGGFFDVMGVELDSGEEHLLMYQPQSALTGLALCRIDGTMHVLLQARIEPGNTGIGQWGPTIQSTPANFLALHGGKPTPALELFYRFSRNALPIGTSVQLDLGERYFHKSKWHNYVLVDEPIAVPDHMAWVSWETIHSVLVRDNCLNADLRSLLAVLNWEKLERGNEHAPSPPTSDLLSTLLHHRATYSVDYKIKDVSEMRDWSVTNAGIEPRTNPNLVSTHLYHTSCGTREVKAWYQPMISAPSRGRVTLKVDAGHCLLQARREIGIEGGFVLTASEIINPGDPVPASDEQVIASFIQSDEGGRFNQHETEYQLVKGDRSMPVAEGMKWVPMAALKQYLALSNVASFQLRCMASLLITEMNPTLGT